MCETCFTGQAGEQLLACTPGSNRALFGTALCRAPIVIRLGPYSFVLILFCDLTNVFNQTKSSPGRGGNGWLEDYVIFQPTSSYSAVFPTGTLSPWAVKMVAVRGGITKFLRGK